MQCNSPRASAGLIRLAASIAPSPLPAPTSVCISSMNKMTWPAASVTSVKTAFKRSSKSPRYFAPAINAPISKDNKRLPRKDSGTSPFTMRKAKPSAIAVLPTPGSPIKTGLFLVRRLKTCIVRRISSSRPMIGSILPSSARVVRSWAYFFNASYPSSALAVSAVRPLRMSLIAAFNACAFTLPSSNAAFAPDLTIHRAIKRRSTGTKLSPAFLAIASASAKTLPVALSIYIWAASPVTLGNLANAASTDCKTTSGLPPDAVIKLLASP